jgi:hypothetical protein
MRKAGVVSIGLFVLLSLAFGLRSRGALTPSSSAPAAKSIQSSALSERTLAAASTLSATLYVPLTMNAFDPAYTQPFGIAMYNDISATTGINQMQAAGATRVTTMLRWSDIQPLQVGGYDWSGPDAKLANAAAAGMSIHVLFDSNPDWVTSNPRGPVPPAFMPELDNVVSAIAQRYNGSGGLPRIDAWSFYGEPDNTSAWGFYGNKYADMLVSVAPIVHTANPDAKIWLGGLAYDLFTDDEIHPGVWVRSFLPDTLAQLNIQGGAAHYIDAVAFNFYPISLPRWPTIKEKAQSVRAVMSAYGVGQLPLIVPEMSMWSMWPGNVETQAQQAHWLVHFYVRGMAAGIQQLYWYQVFDVMPVGLGSAQGLFRGTNLNDPKQSYYAYKTLTHELIGRHFDHLLSIPNAEGYAFGSGGYQKSVIWGTQASASTPVTVAQSCARRVDMLGPVTTIIDGGPGDQDGVLNGAIRLSVNFEEPIYVGSC